MLVDIKNACYQLLKILGCDLAAVDSITSNYQFGVLIMQFIFACLVLFITWKMLYNCMIRFFHMR